MPIIASLYTWRCDAPNCETESEPVEEHAMPLGWIKVNTGAVPAQFVLCSLEHYNEWYKEIPNATVTALAKTGTVFLMGYDEKTPVMEVSRRMVSHRTIVSDVVPLPDFVKLQGDDDD